MIDCYKCKSKDNLTTARTWKLKSGEKRKNYICRECATRRRREMYRDNPKTREAIKRNVRNYRARKPDRVKLWGAVQNIKMQPCVECGSEFTHKHHPDPLDKHKIVFLCPPHHSRAHRVV